MTDGIRVLLVDLSRRYGGASVRALTLARHLQADGAVITGLEGSPVVRLARQKGLPVTTVGRYRLDPFIPFRLNQIIRRESFQVIDTQNIQAKFWGCQAALLSNVAFVATLNSSYRNEQGQGWKGRLYSQLDRRTNFRADRFVAVSSAIRQELIRSGIPAEQVDLVSNGVEVEIDPGGGNLAGIRKKLGIPEDAFLFTSVGRLVWAKGFEDLIDAFKVASAKVPQAYVVIAGAGELQPALTARIAQAGLEKRVLLPGHCEPEFIHALLRESSAFVLSSRSEGVPFALLEAAAAGLPILATRCGGIGETLKESTEALLVPVGDVSALSAGMLKLANDRAVADSLGRAARERVRQDCSAQSMAEAMRLTYRKACAHRGKAAPR